MFLTKNWLYILFSNENIQTSKENQQLEQQFE